MDRRWTASLVIAFGLYGCTAETPLEPLPVDELLTYEEVTVDVREAQGRDGQWLLCRRVPTDPFLDHARFLAGDGTLGPRIDFDALPRLVENVQFNEEDIWITELLPLGDGGVVLLGMGIQRDLEDRLHLVMYQLNASLGLVGAPLRRFVRSRVDLGIRDDIDRAYDAKALGCFLGSNAQQVAAVVRSNSNGLAERRLFVLPRTSASSLATSVAIPFADTDHDLQFMLTDPSAPDHVWLGLDTTGAGAGTALLVQRIDLSQQVPLVVDQGIAQARNTQVNDAVAKGSGLVLVGHAEPDQAGQLRPFMASLSSAGSIDVALTFLEIETERSVCAYAVDATVEPAWVGLSLYEQAIMTDELRREDLFGDLRVCRVTTNGGISDERTLIPGQGLRPLAIHERGGEAWVIGVLHPFLNVDLLHSFSITSSAP
ncbi:MAG: hypothetical protein KDB88_12755 [Flavobacteriales bacterium]|nr:hypothetical protein [Flavobacteriales bacterium]